MEGRSLLTTQNQPFALSLRTPRNCNSLDNGLCRYRMISKEYKFCFDGESKEEDLGLPGRVFLRKLPESTPNVQYYTIKEYPLRNQALRCQVKTCLALPVFEPSGKTCVGVIELVFTSKNTCPIFLDKLLTSLTFQVFGLRFSNVYKHSYMQDKENIGARIAAFAEIRFALKVVCEIHGIRLAQTWVPCRICSALVDGCILCAVESPSYLMDEKDNLFLRACRGHHLGKGQGVVGRALSSLRVLFCPDVTQFSISDYHLAHYARDFGFSSSGCFALCLQSTYTGNDVYVLEFFLPERNKSVENTRTSLSEILGTMAEYFNTCKLASGEELGQKLSVEEVTIDFQSGQKLNSVQISETDRSSPSREPLQNGGEIIQIGSSDEQSMDGINNRRNVVNAERSNIVGTGSLEKGTTKTSKGKHKRTGVRIGISFEDILKTSEMSLEKAAKNLNISRSKLKRVCRDFQIPRWPPRKINKARRSQLFCVDLEQIPHMNSDLPCNQASASVAHMRPRDTPFQYANMVTMRAKYENGITIKFRLSLSSGLVELQQQVARRLKLDAECYYIKYKDEDGELILIACDEDLQDYIHTSKSLGNTSIVVLLEPK